MRPFKFLSRSVCAALTLLLCSCLGADDDPSYEGYGDEDDRVIRHKVLSQASLHELGRSVRIGAGPAGSFGIVAGHVVTPNREIVVLDYRSAEIRRFDASGTELSKVAASGQGPGEIGRAIGLVVDSAGVIWTHDYGNARLSWFGPNGESGSRPALGISINALDAGSGVQNDGSLWLRERRIANPREVSGGVTEAAASTMMLKYSPSVGSVLDTVQLGVDTLVHLNLPNGLGSRPLPYGPQRLVAFDPEGAIWTARSAEYRLIRIDPKGDTTLVIDVDVPSLRIDAEERRESIEALREWYSSVGAEVPDLEELVPWEHPKIEHITVGPDRTIWVQREDSAGTVLESFDHQGSFRSRYRTALDPEPSAPPSIGEGLVVVTVTDSLGVQSLAVWDLAEAR